MMLVANAEGALPPGAAWRDVIGTIDDKSTAATKKTRKQFAV
jgi:hypothetical protein